MRRFLGILVALGLALVALVVPTSAQASTSGSLHCSWGGRAAVSVFVAPGVRAKGWGVRGARLVWNRTGAGPVLRSTAYRSRAGIEVRVNNGGLRGDALAQTGGLCGTKMIIEVDNTKGLSAWSRYVVMLHELGHALGLAHRGDKCGGASIMCPWLYGIQRAGRPTWLDRRTLAYIYRRTS